MSSVLEFNADTGCLTITGELTIYQAKEATDLLREAFGTGKLNCLDLAGVTELDTAGLQLLMVAAGLDSASGKAIEVLTSSEVVLQALGFAGVKLESGETGDRGLSQ